MPNFYAPIAYGNIPIDVRGSVGTINILRCILTGGGETPVKEDIELNLASYQGISRSADFSCTVSGLLTDGLQAVINSRLNSTIKFESVHTFIDGTEITRSLEEVDVIAVDFFFGGSKSSFVLRGKGPYATRDSVGIIADEILTKNIQRSGGVDSIKYGLDMYLALGVLVGDTFGDGIDSGTVDSITSLITRTKAIGYVETV